ncbi:uncharacterized protein BJ212DRAFT_1277387 [Suillus subaureus]|uniref:Uncharacterized protein n=1 Tax=Suillus subaureus TaxID=48587 RepID=A0A9P7E5T0_9AGAM|nr:uncharacterized protein BJ212DRAFT_1277387 [Suillus subaureus]KAG1811823.1 hypothetical protein BJ212DRAFT_1277387 [Suillus subaureus]
MSTSPRFSSVSGNWRKASISSVDIDLEAQNVTGTHTSFTVPAAIRAAHSAATPTHTPQRNDNITDLVDDFFGVTYTRATRESRHDSYVAPSRTSVALDGEAPPPYTNATEPPAYSSTPAEPVTLAMYLYKFGFLFPPFWVLGAIILLSPLKAPADFEPTKSEDERQELVRIMRDAEIKWAKRSAWALLVFLIAIGIILGAVIGVLRS